MIQSEETTVIALPELLGLTAAAPLAARLVTLQGSPVSLDASKVERLGGLCLQVLLSARVTWAAGGAPLVIRDPSPAFKDAWATFGAPPLSA